MPLALCIRSGASKEALQETRGDKVSGAKLVVYIDAIPWPNYMPLSSQSHPRRGSRVGRSTQVQAVLEFHILSSAYEIFVVIL